MLISYHRIVVKSCFIMVSDVVLILSIILFSVSPPDKGEDTDPERVLAVIGRDYNWKYDNDNDVIARVYFKVAQNSFQHLYLDRSL